MPSRLEILWKNAPVLRAIAAQALAFLLLLGLALLQRRLFPPLPFLAWPVLQGTLAGLLSRRWKLGPAWLLGQALLPFALFWHLEHTLPAWCYPAFLLPLALIFGGGLFTRVPLYNSSRHAWETLLNLLPHHPLQFIDLGAGLGGPLAYLARCRPDCEFKGVEASLAPFLVAWLRTLPLKNCRIRLKSFWQEDLGNYSTVYAFLSPVPMPALWEKACREMPADSLLVSHSFEVPKVRPAQILPVKGKKDACLLVYRIDQRK